MDIHLQSYVVHKKLAHGGSSQLIEQSHTLEKVSDVLREVEKTLSMVLKSRKEDWKPAGY